MTPHHSHHLVRLAGFAVLAATVAIIGLSTRSQAASVAQPASVQPAACDPLQQLLGGCTPEPSPPSPPPTSPPSSGSPPSSDSGPTSTSSSSSTDTATPTAPPPAPALPVQQLRLTPSRSQGVVPGSDVPLQVTAEASRGPDLYSVPGAPVTLRIESASGEGASVNPSAGATDATGQMFVTVHTGDKPGDTVVSARAGSASTTVTLHSEAAAPGTGAGAAPAAPPAQPASASAGRRTAIAVLGALIAAMVSAVAASLVLGRRRRRTLSVLG